MSTFRVGASEREERRGRRKVKSRVCLPKLKCVSSLLLHIGDACTVEQVALGPNRFRMMF